LIGKGEGAKYTEDDCQLGNNVCHAGGVRSSFAADKGCFVILGLAPRRGNCYTLLTVSTPWRQPADGETGHSGTAVQLAAVASTVSI